MLGSRAKGSICRFSQNEQSLRLTKDEVTASRRPGSMSTAIVYSDLKMAFPNQESESEAL